MVEAEEEKQNSMQHSKNLATQRLVSGFIAYSFLMMTPPKTSRAGKYILTHFPGNSRAY